MKLFSPTTQQICVDVYRIRFRRSRHRSCFVRRNGNLPKCSRHHRITFAVESRCIGLLRLQMIMYYCVDIYIYNIQINRIYVYSPYRQRPLSRWQWVWSVDIAEVRSSRRSTQWWARCLRFWTRDFAPFRKWGPAPFREFRSKKHTGRIKSDIVFFFFVFPPNISHPHPTSIHSPHSITGRLEAFLRIAGLSITLTDATMMTNGHRWIPFFFSVFFLSSPLLEMKDCHVIVIDYSAE